MYVTAIAKEACSIMGEVDSALQCFAVTKYMWPLMFQTNPFYFLAVVVVKSFVFLLTSSDFPIFTGMDVSA